MTRLLASVRSVEEARAALAGGADLIDLKDPAAGSLGALDARTIAAVVAAIGGVRPVSATAGDVPPHPEQMRAAAQRIAHTGVDFVKIGFFGRDRHEECARVLVPLAAQGTRLVAVLFADLDPPLDHLALLAECGFAGAMLDTAGKAGRPLPECMSAEVLSRFVAECRRHGLMSGLAGSLRESDVAPLAALGPDFLGFRGALCAGGDRLGALAEERVASLRQRLGESAAAGGLPRAGDGRAVAAARV